MSEQGGIGDFFTLLLGGPGTLRELNEKRAAKEGRRDLLTELKVPGNLASIAEKDPSLINAVIQLAQNRSAEANDRAVLGGVGEAPAMGGAGVAPTRSAGGDGFAGMEPILALARKDSGNNYNALTYKKGGAPGGVAPLEDMTVAQVMAFQKQMPSRGHASTAVGGYQMIAPTLAKAVNMAGIDPASTRFDKQTQDLLAAQLVKARGYDDYAAGKLPAEKFLANLSQEWAILPKDASGRGSYDGFNGNKAGVSYDVAMRALGGEVPDMPARGSSNAGPARSAPRGAMADVMSMASGLPLSASDSDLSNAQFFAADRAMQAGNPDAFRQVAQGQMPSMQPRPPQAAMPQNPPMPPPRPQMIEQAPLPPPQGQQPQQPPQAQQTPNILPPQLRPQNDPSMLSPDMMAQNPFARPQQAARAPGDTLPPGPVPSDAPPLPEPGAQEAQGPGNPLGVNTGTPTLDRVVANPQMGETTKRYAAREAQTQLQRLEAQREQLVRQAAQGKALAGRLQTPAGKAQAEAAVWGVTQQIEALNKKIEVVFGAEIEAGKPTGLMKETREAMRNPAFKEEIINQRRSQANNVTVNNGGEDKFANELAAGQAKMFNEMAKDASNARVDASRIAVLRQNIEKLPGGLASGLLSFANQYGIKLSANPSALEAADAILNQMVPKQRDPGSGPMSDRDIEMYRAGLPRLMNTPDGNRIIMDTMEGVAQYRIAQGQIATDVMTGRMTRAQAADALQKLPDPFAKVKAALGENSNTPSGPAGGRLSPGRYIWDPQKGLIPQ